MQVRAKRSRTEERDILPSGPFQNSGFALAQGFYQAMFVTQAGPTLTVDTKCSCFYRNIDMLHFLSIYLGRDLTINGGLMSNDEQRILVRMRCLEMITIETRHTLNKSMSGASLVTEHGSRRLCFSGVQHSRFRRVR